jgi:glyoxylase-like metal-dependent hydrolase (beta-lactamase superfamily II)/rhodanese-related sulfurtransferase
MQREYAISAVEMKRRLDENRIEFIFDLRNKDEFDAWRIEGRSDIETLNIPQIDFVGEEENYLATFPKDRQIVTICAHGDSSRYSAELLSGRGFDAVSLEGGMDAWSELYETHKVRDMPIYQIYRVSKGCISYLAVSGTDALVVDATRHVDHLLELAGQLNVKIAHVLDTHLQADHISGGRELALRTGAHYHIHPEDASGAVYGFVPLRDGEVISFGESSLQVIHSPGHTPGSSSFLMDGLVLFTGDTIMKKSIGRPDLGGKADEWAVLLHRTLFEKYARIEDGTVILPTHAASIREQEADGVISTTMGAARTKSDLYRIRELKEFVEYIKSSLPESPERYQGIRKVNLGLIDPDEKKRKELEIGKNLCGLAKR